MTTKKNARLEELEKLSVLFKKGIITQEEFEKKKQFLLNGSGGVEKYLYKATVASRWIANLFDGLVVTLAGVLLAVLFSSDEEMVGIIMLLLPVVYSVFFLWKKGATLGKQIMKVRVVDIDDEELSFGKVVLRETVGKFLSAIVLGIGYISAIWNKDKQAWHDKIAGTYVLSSKDSHGKEPWWFYLLVVLFLGLPILGIISAGLLASIDPFEQLKKARDANYRSMAIEVLSANQRYYADKGSFPWSASSNGDCVDLKSAVAGSTEGLLVDVKDEAVSGCFSSELVNTGELKSGYFDNLEQGKVFANIFKPVKLSVCYIPESKEEMNSDETVCDSTGKCYQCFN